jgi:hypothetical protein
VGTPRGREGDAADPANQTDEVDRGGGREMLQGDLGGADLAGAAQAEAADRLRDRRLHARPQGI